jgi:IclR family pca regulon transcriptional regulator
MTKGKLDQGDYIRSLENGLAIVKAFGQDDPTLTLSEAAAKTGMTRAAARRFLLTLTHLGYLEVDGKSFRLRPKILELGERYLTSQPWWNVAQPLIEEAVRKMGESCSLCILDGAEIVYVCRVAVNRLISTNISIGSRLPAYPTALGRCFWRKDLKVKGKSSWPKRTWRSTQKIR